MSGERAKGERANGGPVSGDGRDSGAEELLSDITGEAEARRSEILSQAERQAEEIRRDTDAQIRRLEEEAGQELERRIAAERERQLGQLRLEERKLQGSAKRELLEEVFAAAGRRIREDMHTKRYRPALGELIRQAVAEAGGGPELQVSAGEEELCRGLVEELGLDCTVAGGERLPGTVLACSADGLRRVENGLERRLARARSELEEEVGRLLWGTTTT